MTVTLLRGRQRNLKTMTVSKSPGTAGGRDASGGVSRPGNGLFFHFRSTPAVEYVVTGMEGNVRLRLCRICGFPALSAYLRVQRHEPHGFISEFLFMLEGPGRFVPGVFHLAVKVLQRRPCFR